MKQTLSLLLKRKYIRPFGYKAGNAAGSLGSVGHTVDSTFFTRKTSMQIEKRRVSASQLVSITMGKRLWEYKRCVRQRSWSLQVSSQWLSLSLCLYRDISCACSSQGESSLTGQIVTWWSNTWRPMIFSLAFSHSACSLPLLASNSSHIFEPCMRDLDSQTYFHSLSQIFTTNCIVTFFKGSDSRHTKHTRRAGIFVDSQ